MSGDYEIYTLQRSRWELIARFENSQRSLALYEAGDMLVRQPNLRLKVVQETDAIDGSKKETVLFRSEALRDYEEKRKEELRAGSFIVYRWSKNRWVEVSQHDNSSAAQVVANRQMAKLGQTAPKGRCFVKIEHVRQTDEGQPIRQMAFQSPDLIKAMPADQCDPFSVSGNSSSSRLHGGRGQAREGELTNTEAVMIVGSAASAIVILLVLAAGRIAQQRVDVEVTPVSPVLMSTVGVLFFLAFAFAIRHFINFHDLMGSIKLVMTRSEKDTEDALTRKKSRPPAKAASSEAPPAIIAVDTTSNEMLDNVNHLTIALQFLGQCVEVMSRRAGGVLGETEKLRLGSIMLGASRELLPGDSVGVAKLLERVLPVLGATPPPGQTLMEALEDDANLPLVTAGRVFLRDFQLRNLNTAVVFAAVSRGPTGKSAEAPIATAEAATDSEWPVAEAEEVVAPVSAKMRCLHVAHLSAGAVEAGLRDILTGMFATDPALATEANEVVVEAGQGVPLLHGLLDRLFDTAGQPFDANSFVIIHSGSTEELRGPDWGMDAVAARVAALRKTEALLITDSTYSSIADIGGTITKIGEIDDLRPGAPIIVFALEPKARRKSLDPAPSRRKAA